MIIGSGMVAVCLTLLSVFQLPILSRYSLSCPPGLVNIFIPSGGGQWAIPKYNHDGSSAAVQTYRRPSWLLPGVMAGPTDSAVLGTALLGVAGLGARDIMGYCVIWTVVSGLIISGTFLIL